MRNSSSALPSYLSGILTIALAAIEGGYKIAMELYSGDKVKFIVEAGNGGESTDDYKPAVQTATVGPVIVEDPAVFDDPSTQTVEFDGDAALLANCNTPEDYEKLLAYDAGCPDE